MNPVKLSTTVKSGVAHKSKIKMTPKMVQDEMNRIYYLRSLEKSNARFEGAKKRKLVKIRQLKNRITQYFTKTIENTKLEINLWPFKNF